MLNRFLTVLLAALTLALPMGAPTSTADPVDNTNPGLHVTRIVPVTSGPLAYTGRIIVTLSNGKSSVLRPCRFEDGRRCYWQGEVRGNQKGESFVVTRGKRFFVNLDGLWGYRA